MTWDRPEIPGRLATGIPGLDTVLGGGLRSGSAYLVHGAPGSGKTVLANQICYAQAARGGTALYLSLLSEPHDRMLRDLAGFGFFESGKVSDGVSYISTFAALQEEGLDGLLRLIAQEFHRAKPTVAVFDGLFVAHDHARDEIAFRRFLHELKAHAALTETTVLLLTNASRKPSSPEHTVVDGWIELIDELHDARAARTLVLHKQRGSAFLRGRHLFAINDEGIVLYPRLEALPADLPPFDAVPTGRVSTGIAGLDQMIGGGYPAASATLVMGPTGSGKTTLGLHFLAGSTPEDRGVLFGFYETPARLVARARGLGLDLDGLRRRGALEIVWQSPAENLPDELAHRLIDLVERGRIRRVFLDGLNGLMSSFIFPGRLPLFLGALNNRLRNLGVSVVYSYETATLYMPESIPGGHFSGTMDNVVLMHFAPGVEVIQREMVVLKIRDSGLDARREPFHITGHGLRFGSELNGDSRRSGGIMT